MAERLKIYACSGIGDAPKGRVQMYDYWTDNTNTLDNTQAVNGLLSDINLLLAEVSYIPTLTDSEVVERLNKIDLLAVCLIAAEHYAQHYTQLEKAGRVIDAMLAQGLFESYSLDNAVRDDNLDDLIAYFEEAMAINEQYEQTNSDFTQWFATNVIERNKVGLSAAERNAMQSALTQAVSGIGELDWRDDKELSKYLSDAGTYFLYTFFTDAQINRIPAKNRVAFKQKRSAQNYTYNYCKGRFVGIYGTEEKYKQIVRTGIITKFEAQPEQVCEDIANGNRSVSGIGIGTAVILAIISAVVSVVIALITAICEAVAKSNAAKYASLDNKIVESGNPNEDDFAGLDMGGGSVTPGTTTAGTTSKMPLLIIAAAAAFALLKKKLR